MADTLILWVYKVTDTLLLRMYVGKRDTLSSNKLQVENNRFHPTGLHGPREGVEKQAQVQVPFAVNTTATHTWESFFFPLS